MQILKDIFINFYDEKNKVCKSRLFKKGEYLQGKITSYSDHNKTVNLKTDYGRAIFIPIDCIKEIDNEC